jgi:hypothetical protein
MITIIVHRDALQMNGAVALSTGGTQLGEMCNKYTCTNFGCSLLQWQ